MLMALSKGRPKKYGRTMRKTSLAMPDELLDALKEDALKSGFRHWSEQLRYEAMKPRGLWKEPKHYMPTQDAPGKA